MRNIYPRNVYKIQKKSMTIWIILVLSTRVNKSFKKVALINFESICFKKDTFKRANKTTWITKHVSITVSNFSNHVEDQICFCSSDRRHLVAPFAGTVENLSHADTKNLFFDIDTTKKIKLGSVLEKLTQRHNQREHVRRVVKNQKHCENENCASTQFPQIKKNHLVELEE